MSPEKFHWDQWLCKEELIMPSLRDQEEECSFPSCWALTRSHYIQMVQRHFQPLCRVHWLLARQQARKGNWRTQKEPEHQKMLWTKELRELWRSRGTEETDMGKTGTGKKGLGVGRTAVIPTNWRGYNAFISCIVNSIIILKTCQ